MIELIFCIVIGFAVLFGVFFGFRKLSQYIIMRHFSKMMQERGKK